MSLINPEQTIFEGQTLLVKASRISAERQTVISFGHRRRRSDTFQQVGFGEQFFRGRGHSCIYFMPKMNNWWQNEEFDTAVSEAKAFLARHEVNHLIGYGCSMGGYGALLSQDRFNFERIVAISPQAAIGAERVPDPRWDSERQSFNIIKDDIRLSPPLDLRVAYDPLHRLDRLHVDYLRRLAPVTSYHLSFAGHAVLEVLRQYGMLSDAISRMLFDPLYDRDFRETWKATRGTRPLIYRLASKQLSESGHPILGRRLAKHAKRLQAKTDQIISPP